MDTFDRRILAALQADARLTNQELADSVGLSASQCSRRRSALEEAGIITGYHAALSAEALGLEMIVFVQVVLAAHSPENSRAFMALIDHLPEVQEAFSMTGEADYQLKLMVRDLKTLSAILNDVLLAHPTVARVRSSIVLNRLKQGFLLPV